MICDFSLGRVRFFLMTASGGNDDTLCEVLGEDPIFLSAHMLLIGAERNGKGLKASEL